MSQHTDPNAQKEEDAQNPTAATATGNQFVSSGFGEQSILQKIQELFSNTKPTLQEHMAFLKTHRDLYIAELLLQLHTVDVPRPVKVTAALAAFELHDDILIRCLLADIDRYSLPEVLSLCRHLDADRRIRSLHVKLRAMRTDEIQGFEKDGLPNKPARDDSESRVSSGRGRGRGGRGGRGGAPRGRGGRGRGSSKPDDSFGRGSNPNPEVKKTAAAPNKPEGSTGRDDAQKLHRRVTRTLAKIKAFELEIPKRTAEKVEGLTVSLTGKSCTHFREWAGRITELSLRHFMLEFGSLSMWTDLADMIHLDPAKLQMGSFLQYAHEEEAVTSTKKCSSASVAAVASSTGPKSQQLTEDVLYALDLKKRFITDVAKATVKGKAGQKARRAARAAGSLLSELDSIVKHQVPFTLLRKMEPAATWSDKLKLAVASYTDITTVFWWIEEFRCDSVETLLNERLAKDDLPKFGYGKLMERLMWCNGARSKVMPPLIPYAEACLQDYTLPLKTPMAVLGDCSGSMQVAVRTASIIVSLLTALGQAELFFFNNVLVKPPFVPTTIREAIICSDEVKADGATSPCAALEPLYYDKKRMETIVVVTDEQENDAGPRSGKMFDELYELYRKEVSPDAYLVLVSFLGPSEQGEMATTLASRNIPFLQCRLSRDRPDLTKLDMLLGKLSMETTMHKVAAECCAVYLGTKPPADVAAREIKKFTSSFVREGTGGIVRFIKVMANDLSDHFGSFEPLKQLLLDFFSTLQESEFVAVAISRIASICTVEELQEWCDKEWSTNWTDEVSQNTFSNRPLNIKVKRCGDLTAVPREVMEHLMSWVPLKDLKVLEAAGPKTLPVLSIVARDMKFFAKFQEPPGEFDDKIEQIRNMGLLEIFGEEETLKTLKKTRGNVEHAVALLFGEGGQ